VAFFFSIFFLFRVGYPRKDVFTLQLHVYKRYRHLTFRLQRMLYYFWRSHQIHWETRRPIQTIDRSCGICFTLILTTVLNSSEKKKKNWCGERRAPRRIAVNWIWAGGWVCRLETLCADCNGDQWLRVHRNGSVRNGLLELALLLLKPINISNLCF